jgi:hypothetical protein
MGLDDSNKKQAPRIALDTPKAARHSIARLCRMRFRGELTTEVFRDLIYGLSSLRAYDALLADLRIEERLDAIEASITAKPTEEAARPTPYLKTAAPVAARHEASKGEDEESVEDNGRDAPTPRLEQPATIATAPGAGRMRL